MDTPTTTAPPPDDTQAPAAPVADAPSTSLTIAGRVLTPAVLFAPGGIQAILAAIRAKAAATLTDPTTEVGRKAIEKLARQIKASGKVIDDAGKTLGEGHYTAWKAITTERKAALDGCAEIAKEVLAPVEKYNALVAERMAKWEAHIAALIALTDTGSSAGALRDALAAVQSYSTDCEEFTPRAEAAKASAVAVLTGRLACVEKAEAEAAELAQFRAEQAERAQRDRDEQVAKKAREDAEAKAKADRLLIEKETADREARQQREAAEALARVDRERQAAIDAVAKADRVRISGHKEALAAIPEGGAFFENESSAGFTSRLKWLSHVMKRDWQEFVGEAQAAVDAEIARTEAALVTARNREAKAEQDRQRQAAEDQARRDRQVLDDERARLEQVRQQEVKEQKAREDDKERRGQVHKEILTDLDDSGASGETIRKIITMIARGQVRHLKIEY